MSAAPRARDPTAHVCTLAYRRVPGASAHWLWSVAREKTVIWDHVSRGFRELANSARGRSRDQNEPPPSHERSVSAAAAPPSGELTFPGHGMPQDLDASDDEARQAARDTSGRAEKIRKWRHRVLLRKGARMYSSMGVKGGDCSFAMLDSAGVVISWRDLAAGGAAASDSVLGRHVSQFYVSEDIIGGLPQRDLGVASSEGSSTQQGWHRIPGGGVFWGTTVVDAVVLRDGRLQGFSFVTRRSWGPLGQFVRRDDPAPANVGHGGVAERSVRDSLPAHGLCPTGQAAARGSVG